MQNRKDDTGDTNGYKLVNGNGHESKDDPNGFTQPLLNDDLPPQNEMAISGESTSHHQTQQQQAAEAKVENISQDILKSLSHEKWYQDLFNDATLRDGYDYSSAKENLKTALAVYCSLAASILYYLGSEDLGAEYVVGGISVNLLQTFFFTKETIQFFSKMKEQKKLAAVSGVFGVFATCVTTIASYQLSVEKKGAALALILSLLNASGNLPQNLYGMFSAIKRVLNHYDDSPEAREYMHAQLRKTLEEDNNLELLTPEDRPKIIAILNQILGGLVGIALTASQMGYIRSSVDEMTQITGSTPAGFVLGILTNLPGMGISLFVGGKSLAEKVIDPIYDAGHYLLKKVRNQVTLSPTTRDYVFGCIKLITAGGIAGLAYFSSATSRKLYHTEPELPYLPSDDVIDALISTDVDQGVDVFNGVMAFEAANQLLDYLYVRYIINSVASQSAPTNGLVEDLDTVAQIRRNKRDLAALKIGEMFAVIKNDPKEKIEQRAIDGGWVKPVVTRSGFFSRNTTTVPVEVNHTNDTDYQLIRDSRIGIPNMP
jgi:hypothetical protein